MYIFISKFTANNYHAKSHALFVKNVVVRGFVANKKNTHLDTHLASNQYQSVPRYVYLTVYFIKKNVDIPA